MYTQTIRLAIIAAAFIFAAPAFAQDCGCGGSVGYAGSSDNCGRGITQQQAEGLWGGYCSETCDYPGGGSTGGFGGHKLLGGCGSCGQSGGGCGCNSGCFGYPTGGGCGGKLGGCKLGSRHGGGGCKLFGGCKKFSSSAQQCGTSGAYFEEAVGPEYGTSGMQSCVSCNSCGSFDSVAPEMAAPIMMAPMAQPYNGGVDQMVPTQPSMQSLPMQSLPMQNAPTMLEPVVGAIGALN